MMHTASQENLLPARRHVDHRGPRRQDGHQLGRAHPRAHRLGEDATAFLSYHGHHDDEHMDKLYAMLDRMATTDARAVVTVKTSRVVGRLYALQLEELDHV